MTTPLRLEAAIHVSERGIAALSGLTLGLRLPAVPCRIRAIRRASESAHVVFNRRPERFLLRRAAGWVDGWLLSSWGRSFVRFFVGWLLARGRRRRRRRKRRRRWRGNGGGDGGEAERGWRLRARSQQRGMDRRRRRRPEDRPMMTCLSPSCRQPGRPIRLTGTLPPPPWSPMRKEKTERELD
ncbi:hypothetical protein BKA80DRAFT_262880 [Phyllosticta citrichinensis]